MSLEAMSAVWKCQTITSTQKLVSLYISDKVHEDTGYQFFASIQKCIKYTRLKRDTVYKALAELKQKNYITLIEERTGKTNRYRFNIDSYLTEISDTPKKGCPEKGIPPCPDIGTPTCPENGIPITEGLTQRGTEVEETATADENLIIQKTETVSVDTGIPLGAKPPEYLLNQVRNDDECMRLYEEKNLAQERTLGEEVTRVFQYYLMKNQPCDLATVRRWFRNAKYLPKAGVEARKMSLEDEKGMLAPQEYRQWLIYDSKNGGKGLPPLLWKQQREKDETAYD